MCGHEGNVSCVTFSHDETRLASGGLDNTVRVWGIESGEQQLVLRGHESQVFCVAFSDDDERLASGSGLMSFSPVDN
ncbi:MAG: hypothetical protein DWQ34_04175, partial [Planctomycetota bacterium]